MSISKMAKSVAWAVLLVLAIWVKSNGTIRAGGHPDRGQSRCRRRLLLRQRGARRSRWT